MAFEGSDHYEVEVFDSRLMLVWREPRVNGAEARIPDSIVAEISSGAYGWRVTAVMPDGRRVASAVTTFRIRER